MQKAKFDWENTFLMCSRAIQVPGKYLILLSKEKQLEKGKTPLNN